MSGFTKNLDMLYEYAPRLQNVVIEEPGLPAGRITSFECYDVPFDVNCDSRFTAAEMAILALSAAGIERPEIATVLGVKPAEVTAARTFLFRSLIGAMIKETGFGRVVHQSVRYGLLEMKSAPKEPEKPLALFEVAAIRTSAQGRSLGSATKEVALHDPLSPYAEWGSFEGVMGHFRDQRGIPTRSRSALTLLGHATGALTSKSFTAEDPYLLRTGLS